MAKGTGAAGLGNHRCAEMRTGTDTGSLTEPEVASVLVTAACPELLGAVVLLGLAVRTVNGLVVSVSGAAALAGEDGAKGGDDEGGFAALGSDVLALAFAGTGSAAGGATLLLSASPPICRSPNNPALSWAIASSRVPEMFLTGLRSGGCASDACERSFKLRLFRLTAGTAGLLLPPGAVCASMPSLSAERATSSA